jgi:CheY-like chemotaxis protein
MRDIYGARVLIVEDEGVVALLIETMLEDFGCEIVASVANVERAAKVAGSADLDVAILDVNVAGQMVFPVADVLAKRGIPFVFSTGYGVAGLRSDFTDRPVLNKPYQLEDLRRVLVYLVSSDQAG